MATQKGKTEKKVSSKAGKDAGKSVQQSIDLIKKLEKPELKHEDVDQETRDWLAEGGKIQSKYMQLRANQNAKIIRDLIKTMRNRRKIWK